MPLTSFRSAKHGGDPLAMVDHAVLEKGGLTAAFAELARGLHQVQR